MMRNFLLTILFICAGTGASLAQCTPNPANTALITPDTVTNFVSGTVGQPYTQVAHVHPPSDTMANVPPFGNLTVNIDDITINNFGNLPPGLSYTCNPASCIFPGGLSGCVDITGTPTTPGTYELEVAITTNGSVVVLGQTIPVTQQDTIRSYRIIIDPASVGIAETGSLHGMYGLMADGSSLAVTIEARQPAMAELMLIDLFGHRVMVTDYPFAAGTNTLRLPLPPLAAGIYIFSARTGDSMLTGKLLVTQDR